MISKTWALTQMEHKHFVSIVKDVENRILDEINPCTECLVYSTSLLSPGTTIETVVVGINLDSNDYLPWDLSCTIDVAGRNPDAESLSQEALLYLTYSPNREVTP